MLNSIQMKSFRFWVSSMLLASLFLSCACRQEDEIPIPQVLKINTYGMLEEAMDIQVTGPEGLEVEIDFGDGTTASATTNNVVTHAYTAPGDYTLSASGDGLSVTNKVRIYGLVAISALMEDITAPGYDYILNMSHRGNCSDKSIPENSIAALRNCIAKGVEFMEIDTHITSDGIVVVCHDETVDRTTDGTGSIPDMTYAEIQKLHLRDRNGNVTTEKMPTLEEILKAGRGKIYFDLDYSPRTATTAQVMEVVQKLNMTEQCLYYCNSPEKVTEVVSLDPSAHPYVWFTNYGSVQDLGRRCFSQASANSDVSRAEAAGLVTTVMTSLPENYEYDLEEARNIVADFRNVKVIMSNASDVVLDYLRSIDRHN